MSKLLSVIVPVYNADSTLQRCLESILNQSYRDFELILVDDGSTDKSTELCDEYALKDARIKVLHIKNSGTFQARKAGVAETRGEILAFSDADDWFEPEAFEIAMQIFQAHHPDILTFTYLYDDKDVEKNLYDEKLYPKDEIEKKIIPGMMFDTAMGVRRLNPSLCCKIMKKKLYVEVTETVKDRITLGEDALVTYPAVCKAESLLVCNKPLYHYNNNTQSCTHVFPLERIKEIKKFQNNITRLFKEMEMLEILQSQVENYVRSFLAMVVRNWYGIELSSVSFSFPYQLIPLNSKVFIYGAGDVGKSYINELKIKKYATIAGWADRDYKKIKEYNNECILAPEMIKEKMFDILLIAVYNEKVAYGIKKDLIHMGIEDDKIVWTKPVRIM